MGALGAATEARDQAAGRRFLLVQDAKAAVSAPRASYSAAWAESPVSVPFALTGSTQHSARAPTYELVHFLMWYITKR